MNEIRPHVFLTGGGEAFTYQGKLIVAITEQESKQGPSRITVPLGRGPGDFWPPNPLDEITVTRWLSLQGERGSWDLSAAAPVPAGMRRFQLHRDEDETGTSGTGIVVEGCRFSSGMVALTWLCGPDTSWCWYPSIEAVEAIHGHGGRTRIVWLDEAR